MALGETPDGLEALDDLRDASALIARNVTRAHKLVQDFKKVSVDQITDIKERVDLADVARVLEDQGVAAFSKAFDELLGALDTKAVELGSGR